MHDVSGGMGMWGMGAWGGLFVVLVLIALVAAPVFAAWAFATARAAERSVQALLSGQRPGSVDR